MPLRTRHALFVAFMVVGLLAVWFGNSHAETTYTYDELNRLRIVDYGDGTKIEYIYDAAGNRILEIIQLDATPPTGTSVVDSGEPFTNRQTTLTPTLPRQRERGSTAFVHFQFLNDNH